jgi:hypothetical protein
MPDFHDPDIAAMKLSDGEKNGLQVYRNYSRAFEQDRAKRFAESVQADPLALTDLTTILQLIAEEEPRTLPVIACAYADDQLKEMFRREVPEGVPGGRSELLSGFGPLSRLSQRVQMAYAFGWLSKDVLVEVDHLRKIRNDVSHKWDMKLLESKMSQLIEQRQHRIEEYLGDGVHLPENFHALLQPMQKLRVRLIWLLGRITYESHLWVPALKENLVPQKVLYGPNAPAMLSQVSAACVEITRARIIPS